ncbi:FRG1-like family-domain-containing protein [Mariannaea sp. PMI_226]|nr:FRG1-like family-domain-containing protein [Mariannaea sp. PMI_226]
MVKPLTFKGDKRPKKRKRTDTDKAPRDANPDADLDATGDAQKKQGQDADNDDSWVAADTATDISGPIMIVLPTEKPSALACDPSGTVFAIPIENIVDGNPITAEPHDVRQVWVANRIVGTDNFKLKGHHGKHLSCDKIGALSAVSEAVSPLETLRIVEATGKPGTFHIQTLRDTFITIKPTTSKAGGAAGAEVRGDSEESSPNATFYVRMQARFKPRLRASKEEKIQSKISRKELEEAVGRRLDEDEVKKLKRARREGDYHERLLEIKVKGKHDKYG